MKNILLCVTGGIAVYKAVALTSKLVQSGYAVKVMMTKSACEFVNPISFQSIARDYVYTDTFDEKEPQYVSHIQLADWADMVVIAPATANIIGKLSHGIADDMISTTLLATEAPVIMAPAMNVHMYNHPIVQENMQKLQRIGYEMIEPNEGFLACGYVGKGRMSEPEEIVTFINDYNNRKQTNEKSVMIEGNPIRVRCDGTLEIVDTNVIVQEKKKIAKTHSIFTFYNHTKLQTIDDLFCFIEKEACSVIYDNSGIFSPNYPYKEDIPQWIIQSIEQKRLTIL